MEMEMKMEGNSSVARVLEVEVPASTYPTSDSRAELIRSVFITRQDTYAVQKEKGDNYGRKHESLTNEVLNRHIRKEITVAVYPAKDNTTKWLVFDIDHQNDPKSDILTIKECLESLSIPSYIEYSGRGYHLWVFFENPVANHLARSLADSILKTRRSEITIEIFPKQDSIPNVGSCVKLPFGVNRKTGERCVFLDEDFQQIPEEADFLRSIKKVSEEVLEKAVGIAIAKTTQASEPQPPCIFKEPCIALYFKEGAKEGQRSLISYQLSIRLKEMGVSETQALDLLDTWRVWRCETVQSEFTKPQLTAQIKSAYHREETKKAKCGHCELKKKCVGSSNCDFLKSIPEEGGNKNHNNTMYLRLGWQKHLSSAELAMVAYVLPHMERDNGVIPGKELFTTTSELIEWSGSSKPRETLIKLREKGLIEYLPGQRGGKKDRRPTKITRISPIPKPPVDVKEPSEDLKTSTTQGN